MSSLSLRCSIALDNFPFPIDSRCRPRRLNVERQAVLFGALTSPRTTRRPLVVPRRGKRWTPLSAEHRSSTLLSEGSRHHLSGRPFICPPVVVGRSVGGSHVAWRGEARRRRGAGARCNSQQRAIACALRSSTGRRERER